MNPFEKDFNLSNSFPSFKLEESKKAEILDEIKKTDVSFSRRSKWGKNTRNLFALAATILLTFGILTGVLSYQTAAFNQDKKILSDVSISMEKARILIVKYSYDRSGIDSMDKAYELLEKYYTSDALHAMYASVKNLHDKELRDKEEYDKFITGTIAHLAMGNINSAEEVEISKLGGGKVKVSWFDKKINDKVTIICKLEEKRWKIKEVNIDYASKNKP